MESRMLIIWMVKIRNDNSDVKTWKHQISTKCWVRRSSGRWRGRTKVKRQVEGEEAGGRWRGRIDTSNLEPETTQSHQLVSTLPKRHYNWFARTTGNCFGIGRRSLYISPKQLVSFEPYLYLARYTCIFIYSLHDFRNEISAEGEEGGEIKNSISKVKTFSNIIDISYISSSFPGSNAF